MSFEITICFTFCPHPPTDISIPNSDPLKQTRIFGTTAKEETSFSIIGKKRNLDLECISEFERDKWVDALECLMRYRTAHQIA